MSVTSQQLSRQYRRTKRLTLLLILVCLILLGFIVPLWLPPLVLLVFWVIHEAWFSDHLFYSPKADYRYRFPEHIQPLSAQIVDGHLQLTEESAAELHSATLIAKIHVSSDRLGRWFDPSVSVGQDQQTFERGAQGVRYINLTGQADALINQGLPLEGRFCSIAQDVQLYVFEQSSPVSENIMILAPHAGDAEFAAFGLYSSADNVSIVTLTQGEIEAEHYQRLGLTQQQAAQLKGRLRSWDSIAIALWGGVPQANCVQLGYYCMQLEKMIQQPEMPFGSIESGEANICSVRQHNTVRLAADETGLPTWENLVADLAACLIHFKPDVVVMPHPELAAHADHRATGQAFFEALESSEWRPQRVFLYAKHLQYSDRWPMGSASTGVALPPALVELPADELFSYVLDEQQQLDKAMALLMEHDLQTPQPLKRRVRRTIQQVLTGRRWPKSGENDVLRKAVRKHELFWVREL